MIIAWDIETCPQPLDQLTDRQRRRYDKLMRQKRERDPDAAEDDLSRLVRSIHPQLCWICCISVVRTDRAGEAIQEPRSFTAALQSHEDVLLAHFWQAVCKMPGMVTWTTFNGKRFDCDVLKARTLHHGIRPIRADILKTHPYRHKPHADLATLFRDSLGLADLCELLGVESPKAAMSGADVWPAVQQGRIADVAKYCERDVIATLQCYLESRHVLV